MPNLYQLTAKKEVADSGFTNGEITSIAYHDIFDYPLTISEMIRWRASNSIKTVQTPVIYKNGYYLSEGKEGLIYKRTLRKRISERKIEKAKKAADLLSLIPYVKMVAVTGSLAMQNSGDEGDIDLMMATKNGKLWTTRAISLLLLNIFGFDVRKSDDKNQKDKLCLNIWIDETDMIWRKGRNIYTAHEVAQIFPLVNKDKTYEKFIFVNSWIKRFWPNAVKIPGKVKIERKKYSFNFIELLAYKLQKFHMHGKITRETVTRTKALFHPQDWGKIVLSRFSP